MPDPQKPLPTLEQSIKDLTANIPVGRGGSNAAQQEDDKWFPLKKQKDAQGRHAVIFTFEAGALRADSISGALFQTTVVGSHLSRLTRQVMEDIEKVADVKFYEAGKADKDLPAAEYCSVQDADLAFFRAKEILDPSDREATPLYDKDVAGIGTGQQIENGPRDVLILKDNVPQAILFHEISHAVAAISHPQNQNPHPDYPSSLSVMSHHLPSPEEMKARIGLMDFSEHPAAFGSRDAATWQHIFGKSRHPDTLNPFVEIAGSEATVVHKSVPATVRVHASDDTKDLLYIDLAERDRVAITARDVAISVAPGTQLQHVLTDDHYNKPMIIKGNSLSNHLSGGAGNDLILPRGGNDMLTGGKGGDAFCFNADSGTHNIITDFNANGELQRSGNKEQLADLIIFQTPEVHHVELRGFSPTDQKTGNKSVTTVEAKQADGHTLASVHILNRSPEEIARFITQQKKTASDPHPTLQPVDTRLLPTPVPHAAPAILPGSKQNIR